MNNGSTVIKKSNKMTLSYFNSVILGDHLVFICIENFWNLLTNGILMNLCQTSLCLRLSFPICMSVASCERNFFDMKISKKHSLINYAWRLTNLAIFSIK